MTTASSTNRPFLKWLGGKSRVKELVASSFPDSFDGFHDVFLGGGAVLIHMLHLATEGTIRAPQRVRACDLNTALVGAFRNVRDHPHELLAACEELQSRYNDAPEQRDMYMVARETYNSMEDRTSVDASAHFVFLNKTGFRGMYRENKGGNFNVPFGNYRRVTLLDRTHVLRLAELFRPVVFDCKSYDDSLHAVQSNDAVYLDPPYVPIKNGSFTNYHANGFSKHDHDTLFDLVDALRDRGAHVVLSNAATPEVFERFIANRYYVRRIESSRTIHATNPRSTATEVLVASLRPTLTAAG